MSFFKELKQRLVFKVGVAYLTVCWLLVQIVWTLSLIYGLPDILVKGIAFMFSFSFLIILLMTLAYEVTHKTRGWEAIDEPGPRQAGAGKKFSGIIIGLLFLASALLLVDIFLLMKEGESVATVPRSVQEAAAPDVEIVESPFEKSIAVLPFTDLSENHDQEYFSDGFSQDLINRLAMMPGLQVTGRESSFHYRGRDEVPGVIGESLQVGNILTGSVRRSGDRLRVTAQLVSTGDGLTLWSRSWDKGPADVFAIQTGIAGEVATALNVTPGSGELTVPGMTGNIDAYDKTLRAMALYNRFTPDNVLRAIDLLEEAVSMDPGYGRGWLMLGTIYDESRLTLSPDQAKDFPAMAARAFGRAAAIAADMPELLLVEAGNLRDDGRFKAAEEIYRRYFERYGFSNGRALEEYAQLLSRTGQINDAIAMLQRARRLDPLAPRFIYQLALHELYRDQVEKARALASHGLGLQGGEFLFNALGWEIAMNEGDIAGAARRIREYYAANPEGNHDAALSRHFMEKLAGILSLNDFEKSADDITALINDPSVTPLELRYVARLTALMGQPEIALDYWFGVQADPAVWDDVYAEMRRLPDFNRLLQEKGMVDYWRETGDWGDFCLPAGERDFVCK